VDFEAIGGEVLATETGDLILTDGEKLEGKAFYEVQVSK